MTTDEQREANSKLLRLAGAVVSVEMPLCQKACAFLADLAPYGWLAWDREDFTEARRSIVVLIDLAQNENLIAVNAIVSDQAREPIEFLRMYLPKMNDVVSRIDEVVKIIPASFKTLEKKQHSLPAAHGELLTEFSEIALLIGTINEFKSALDTFISEHG